MAIKVTTTGSIRNRLRHWFIGLSTITALALCGPAATAHTRHSHHAIHLASRHTHGVRFAGVRGRHFRYAATGHIRYTAAEVRYAERHPRYAATARYFHSGLQCVPYAREVSHIELSGDAFLWWA